MSAHIVIDWLVQIPNPTPVKPDVGGDKILGLLNNIKWGAGVAIILGFLIGLAIWVGGRWVDHHRAGKVGVVMMLCALVGAILYGISWPLLNGFAGG